VSAKNGSFGFAKVRARVMEQNQMCHLWVSLRILKFLRVGKVLIEGTEFSYHDEVFLEAGISPVITS
jgi:hypothetical protein